MRGERGFSGVGTRATDPREIISGLDAARRAVLRELGHEACTSGFNILFEDQLAFAVNQKAEVINLA